MPKEKQKKRTISVSHFRNKCIGCGACEMVCPKYWKIDEDGRAVLKDALKLKHFYKGEINTEDYEENKLAAELCPTGVIKID
jgi:ferredoxin